MAHYRLYHIGRDGRFIRADDVVAEDDRSAITAARAVLGVHDLELWERDRKIVKLDGSGTETGDADHAA